MAMAMLTAEFITATCNGLAAIFALVAAVLWMLAARQPVGVPGLSPYISGLDDPILKEMQAHGEKILRGASLNKRAAFFAGLSALASFLSWLLPRLL